MYIIYIYICMYRRISAEIALKCVFTCMYLYIFMYISCERIFTDEYQPVHPHVHTHTYTQTHAHIHKNTPPFSLTHTHTHKHTHTYQVWYVRPAICRFFDSLSCAFWRGQQFTYARVTSRMDEWFRIRTSVVKNTVTGWRRPIKCLVSLILFHKRATKHRALLREMTYKDKASYESLPPCTSFLRGGQQFTHEFVPSRMNKLFHIWMSVDQNMVTSFPRGGWQSTHEFVTTRMNESCCTRLMRSSGFHVWMSYSYAPHLEHVWRHTGSEFI